MKEKTRIIKYPNCPKCNSNENIVKNGHVKTVQRWRCKSCECDFLQQKTLRTPKFKYYDLKLLAVFLLYAGFTVEDIFKNLISVVSDNVNTSKVVYQWSKQFQKIAPEQNIKDLNYSCKVNRTKNFKEYLSLKDEFIELFEKNTNEAHFIYFKIDSMAPNLRAYISSNGMQSEHQIKPDMLLQLLFCILGCNSEDIFLRLFDESYLSLFKENLDLSAFGDSASYSYTNYLSKLEEITYEDIKYHETSDLFYNTKKALYCFIIFDYKDVNIAMIKVNKR